MIIYKITFSEPELCKICESLQDTYEITQNRLKDFPPIEDELEIKNELEYIETLLQKLKF